MTGADARRRSGQPVHLVYMLNAFGCGGSRLLPVLQPPQPPRLHASISLLGRAEPAYERGGKEVLFAPATYQAWHLSLMTIGLSVFRAHNAPEGILAPLGRRGGGPWMNMEVPSVGRHWRSIVGTEHAQPRRSA